MPPQRARDAREVEELRFAVRPREVMHGYLDGFEARQIETVLVVRQDLERCAHDRGAAVKRGDDHGECGRHLKNPDIIRSAIEREILQGYVIRARPGSKDTRGQKSPA